MPNLILMTDSYKASHFLQYPPGLTRLYAYLESRGGDFTHSVFFGLQHLLSQYLCAPIIPNEVEEAAEFFAAHGLPFNRDGWENIWRKHGGRLPIRIRAVPEGSVVPTKNVLMDVESTDPEFPWLVGWVETLLMRIWYPTTVATLSWHARQVIDSFLRLTADDPASEIDFKLHDFGARGVSSHESAGIGGAAHLVSFKGTDTVEGVIFARDYYEATMAGFSIPAAEHSTVITWGREGEVDSYRHALKAFGKPGATFAVVSDSYNVYEAVDRIWGGELREEVKRSGATLVIRPDSGDPAHVLLQLLRSLGSKFGTATNAKGYKVLNSVRLIQGDGMDFEAIRYVLARLTHEGWSASNLAFGMGGGLLQKVNRDTLRFAYKVSECQVGDETRAVKKEPVTDPHKRSKAGKLDLVRRDGKWQTVPYVGIGSELVTVFENGEIKKRWTFDEVRERARAGEEAVRNGR